MADNTNVSSSQIPNFSRNQTNTDNAGGFYLNSNTATNSNANISAQLYFTIIKIARCLPGIFAEHKKHQETWLVALSKARFKVKQKGLIREKIWKYLSQDMRNGES